MSCTCNYGYECDDGYAMVWREYRVQKSRKQFRCYECGDIIPVGSRYCAAFQISDDGPCTFRRCLSCSALAELLAELTKTCPLWGGLQDHCEYADIDWHEWREKAKAS